MKAWEMASDQGLEAKVKKELFTSLMELVKKWSDAEKPSIVEANRTLLDKAAKLITENTEFFKEYVKTRDKGKVEDEAAPPPAKGGKEKPKIALDEACVGRFTREYKARVSSIKNGRKYAFAKALPPGIPDWNGNGWNAKNNLPPAEGEAAVEPRASKSKAKAGKPGAGNNPPEKKKKKRIMGIT